MIGLCYQRGIIVCKNLGEQSKAKRAAVKWSGAKKADNSCTKYVDVCCKEKDKQELSVARGKR